MFPALPPCLFIDIFNKREIINTMISYRLRILVFTTCGITFFIGVEIGIFNLLFLRISENFGINVSNMGILVSILNIGYTIAPFIFGWVSDKIGKKKTLMIFMPVFSFGCFLAAFSNSLFFFITGIFVTGIGFNLSEIVSSAALSDTFPGKESRYLNFVQFTAGIGSMITPVFLNWFFNHYNIKYSFAFLIPGLGYLLLYPFMVLSECEEPKRDNNKSVQSFKPIVLSSLFLSLFIAIAAYIAMEVGISYFIDSFMVKEFNNPVLGAWIISGFYFAIAFSRLFFSFTPITKRNMVLLGFSVSAIVLILIFFIRNQWFFTVSVICLGLMMGPVWPMLIASGMSSFQERSGTVASILSAGGSFGGVISPIIIGLIAGKAGFYASFLFVGIISATGFLLIKFQKQTESAPVDEHRFIG
jgi:MFS family permease